MMTAGNQNWRLQQRRAHVINSQIQELRDRLLYIQYILREGVDVYSGKMIVTREMIWSQQRSLLHEIERYTRELNQIRGVK